MLEMHPWRNALATIGAGGLHAFLEHLLRLGPEERWQRFCHLVDDAFLRAYVARIDRRRHKIIGCFEGGHMRGAVELIAPGAIPTAPVEATFSVEKDWCCQGVERALLLRAISAARRMGARHLLLDRLEGREALRRTLAQFDAQMVWGGHACTAWLPLTPR
jgi:hypothetical protein